MSTECSNPQLLSVTAPYSLVKKTSQNTDIVQCSSSRFQKSNKVNVFLCFVKLFKCARETIAIKKIYIGIQTMNNIEALCIRMQQSASTLCRRSTEIKRT